MDEIIEEFFEHSFEDVVTEDMFERDYIFPQSKVEDYIMSLVSTPYQQFIDYICTHYNPQSIENSDIPQISNYEACTTKVCQVMKFRDNPGMDCVELGKALFTDETERKEGALFKFGENQVKGASFHGLTHCYYKKWFLTCLGYIFPELDDELKQYLSARTLLRSPFFYLIISEAREKDVNIKKYMSGLSLSTQIRRSSSCMHFFDVIIKQCQIEGVTLHSIYFDKNDVTLPDSDQEEEAGNDNIDVERQRTKSKNIYVILPNGNKIMRKNAIETFVSVLQYIGLERVSTYKERLFSGYPLVCKEERGGEYKWQKEVDGWYVYTYMSNDTKIQLLQSISDFFNLGLTVKYEDGQELEIIEKHTESPKSPCETLSINRLCSIFFDSDTTYLYFWFISILQICQISDKYKIDVRTIYIRMLANAWHPVIRRNLSFGFRDPLGKIVTDLHKTLRIPLESKIEDICEIIEQNKDNNNVKKCLDRITRSLPYSFLHPWIDNSLFNNEIEKLSQKHENGCLYSIHSDYWDTFYIIIDKKWRTYLRDHYIPLLNFAYRELAVFMGNKNRQIYDLVTLLKSNNDTITTSQEKVPLPTGQSLLYCLNTNKKSYIFNSNYEAIYSCSGKIIEINKIIYRVLSSEENFVVREVKLLGGKQIVLSNSIINAYDRSPLYSLFEKNNNIEQIEDIRQKSSDGKYEIKVSGEWYNYKGYLVSLEQNAILSTADNTEMTTLGSDEEINQNEKETKRESSLIGRYVRMFPSQVVGKIIQLKNTTLGRKFVIETVQGKITEIYDDPYLYEILSPSRVRQILKL